MGASQPSPTLLALWQSSVLFPRAQGALSAAESCVLSAAPSHSTQVPFLPLDHMLACGRHCETKFTLDFVMLTLAAMETVSWCVRERRKGQCPAVEPERGTTEQGEAPWYVTKSKHCLQTRDTPPKTQSLSEAYLWRGNQRRNTVVRKRCTSSSPRLRSCCPPLARQTHLPQVILPFECL